LKKSRDGNIKQKYRLVTLVGCPYCEGAKEYLSEKGKSYDIIEEMAMSDTKNKNKWNKIIKDDYDIAHTTFPKIFYGKKFIGGFDDLKNRL